MTVIESNEDDLRKLVFDHPLLIVFYHTPSCETCKQLLPEFKEHGAHYPGITLVSIDAEENHVVGRLVDKRAVPFISLYKSGLLIECKTVANKAEMIQSFNNLLNSKVIDDNLL